MCGASCLATRMNARARLFFYWWRLSRVETDNRTCFNRSLLGSASNTCFSLDALVVDEATDAFTPRRKTSHKKVVTHCWRSQVSNCDEIFAHDWTVSFYTESSHMSFRTHDPLWALFVWVCAHKSYRRHRVCKKLRGNLEKVHLNILRDSRTFRVAQVYELSVQTAKARLLRFETYGDWDFWFISSGERSFYIKNNISTVLFLHRNIFLLLDRLSTTQSLDKTARCSFEEFYELKVN